ncbi:MAG: ABC transporter ATP-binding protein [Candidatus Omnitrophica bacterium]|nr:ABC transporter ATP-binding protein [Candidatus Omnitrophota bacterium]
MTTPIEVTHLTKRYDTVTALQDISFTVASGEIMGFLGPNGAGKTTTLRILTGIIAPTSGSVRIDGLDVTERSLDIYRQRVALADCLLGQPKILILDEPTIGLDPHQIRQTRELITSLGRSATILLSTHILPEVEMTCHRVAIIDKGRIVAVDTPQRLRQRLQGAQLVHVQLRGDAPAIEAALKEVAGVARVIPQGRTDGHANFEVQAATGADVREAIFRLAAERQWPLLHLSHSQASLEDVFIHLTTQEA